MTITRTSAITGIKRTVDLPITQDRYNMWQTGLMLVQEAFPNLNSAQREFLITGTYGPDVEGDPTAVDEWESVFGKDED